MKKLIRLLVLTICILMFSIPVFASSDILVQLNGEILDFTDANGNKVESQIVNNRTMVPMRKIFEVLGADVEWNGETRSIKASTEELEIGLQINNNVATVKDKNGETKEITLDSAPVIINDRTLVPVRFIAESLDKKVGWDDQNKTVIIIDPNNIVKIIKEEAPNFYEFLSTEFKAIDTYEMDFELDGKMEQLYDSELTEVLITGNIGLKLSEKALKADIDLDLSGYEEAIEELGTDKVNMELILDIEKEEVYAKSDLIENSENKWIKYELDEDEKEEFREIIESAKLQSNLEIDKLINDIIPEEGLTISYYDELREGIKFFGNDKLKVTGQKDKTYTYKIDLDDLEKVMKLNLSEKEKEEMNLEFEFKTTIQDGITKESAIEVLLSQKDQMSIEFDLVGELESYNEKVNIKIPSGKNVMTESEWKKENSSDTIAQAIFSGFSSEIGMLKESMQMAVVTAKSEEYMKGNRFVSNAQLYNFIARGGENAVKQNEWLTAEEAESCVCTLIDANYCEDVLGIKLPDRKVESAKGENQQLSYYVTPEGAVFCWPPYEYNGRSYVNNKDTVKDEKGRELSNFGATKDGKVIVLFIDTKEVLIIETEGKDTYFTRGTMDDVVYNTKEYVNSSPLIKNEHMFYSEMMMLEWNVEFEISSIDKDEMKKGNNRSKEQIINYLARGGDLVIKSESDWLTKEEANKLVCTKIEEVYAKYTLGDEVPNLVVDTYNKKGVQASFYITPKGAVFCWPPYVIKDKSFVSQKATVVDEDGNELSGLDATKKANVLIYFEETGEVIIVKNGSKTTFEKGTVSDIVGTEIDNYENFKFKMQELKENSQTGMYTAKGYEAIRGNNRTSAQLYNFIARGGYDLFGENGEGDSKWLIQSDADSVPCFEIDKEYALKTIGEPLPILKVDTYKGKNEEASFFVTPKGEVFCWPPYEHDGKSYVNANVTVKDKNGNEMTAKNATKEKQVTIYFELTKETVIISNESNIKPIEYVKGMQNANGIGVWYYEKGLVEGIDFSKYDNTVISK